jgi:hypothetical protein
MLIETVNLDQDGGDPIPWSRAARSLAGLQPAGGGQCVGTKRVGFP